MTDKPNIAAAIEAFSQLNTIAEAVAGYANVLKNAGVPEGAISHCVAEYHTFLMQLVGQSMLKQPRSLLDQVNETAERMRREGRLP